MTPELVGLIGIIVLLALLTLGVPIGVTLALAGIGGGLSAVGAAWVPGTLALFLVVPWLVRDRPLTPGAWAGVSIGALIAATFTVQRLAFPMVDNTLTLVVVAGYGLVTAGAVLWRRTHGPATERAGLGLLAVGTAVMALSFLPLLLIPYTDAQVLLLVPASHLACQALFPGALLVTMLRNRLWGIDLAVSRAVLAGLLALGMVIVYAGLVWAASALVGSSALAQVVAAVGVALAIQPVRRRLETRVHRLVWGDATSPGRAALRIGASLSAGSGSGELLDRLAAAVGESLQLESVVLPTLDGPRAGGRDAPARAGRPPRSRGRPRPAAC